MKLLLGYESDKELIGVIKLLEAIISDGSYVLSDVQVFRAETNVVEEAQEEEQVYLPPIRREDIPTPPSPAVQEEMKKNLFGRKKK